MTLTEIKRQVQPGKVYDVTNHYIKREDHPCFGTVRRQVTRVTTSRIYLSHPTRDESGIDWPKASQVSMDADGSIHLRGGGAAQKPDEPFLTLTPVAATAAGEGK